MHYRGYMIIGLLALLGIKSLSAQVNSTAYQVLLESLYEKSVPLLPVDTVYQHSNQYVILDTRSYEEYAISHIKQARWVGYKTFPAISLQTLPEDTPIVVHCSIGLRSETIGEKLKEQGFRHVYNMYGGIFEWVNRGYPVYHKDTVTNAIHPYSTSWGIWLDRGKKVYSWK